MNVGSLFSGIGGIELGFEREEFITEWFIENEPYAQAILRKHFPNAKIYDDVTKIDFRTIPKVDILTGGFPCQDISNAGKRAGITGSRSSLWKYYLEAIRILRPKYAVIENVSAIINRGLNVVLSDLASIGYDAEWHCISASSIGALHRRDRIFIISYPNSSRYIYGQSEIESTKRGKQTLNKPQPNGSDVEYSKCGRVSTQRNRRIRTCKETPNFHNKTSSHTQSRGMETEWWAVEPCVGRVAYGIPSRVDRIKCLGNAVVPQLAQVIAKAIKECES